MSQGSAAAKLVRGGVGGEGGCGFLSRLRVQPGPGGRRAASRGRLFSCRIASPAGGGLWAPFSFSAAERPRLPALPHGCHLERDVLGPWRQRAPAQGQEAPALPAQPRIARSGLCAAAPDRAPFWRAFSAGMRNLLPRPSNF